MLKRIAAGMVVVLVLVSLVACGSKDNVPGVEQIKADLVGYSNVFISGKIQSVETVEITDTINQKDTIGVLMFELSIEYTNEEGEQNSADISLFYDWTSDGWRLVRG